MEQSTSSNISGRGLMTDRLATGFIFTEGPLWHSDGFLLFSDTPANCIYRLNADGTHEVFLDKSGWNESEPGLLSDMVGSNGLAFDTNGSIIICQHGNHCLAKLSKDRQLTKLATDYKDRPFNSPNDLVVAKDGTIYFTDPPYGLYEQILNPGKFQSSGGVYCLERGVVTQLSGERNYANGVCLSEDEKYLFVSNADKEEQCVLRYPLPQKNKTGEPELWIDRGADGIKLDRSGNLFMATSDGILMLSSGKIILGCISLPEEPSNLCWGGPNAEELFITARSSIYRVRGWHSRPV